MNDCNMIVVTLFWCNKVSYLEWLSLKEFHQKKNVKKLVGKGQYKRIFLITNVQELCRSERERKRGKEKETMDCYKRKNDRKEGKERKWWT